MKKFFKALKIGYKILKKVEAAEQLGIIPQIKIKGIPISAIDAAGTTLVKELKDARDKPRD
jgi:hypothetical protein